MWVPADTQDIEAAIARGDLEETASFDGKKELPPTTKGNPAVAKIMAAMSTAGGSVLYGVGEDADDRLTVRNPIVLASAAERIAQIVQTSISEIPTITFRRYELPDDPAIGYLLVVVPPSPRAPHQLIVGDDRRFYGRGAKGNRVLSEQEIGLLYARRQQQDVNLRERLEEVVATTPYVPEGPDLGSVYAFAQPVPLDDGLWDAAVSRVGSRDELKRVVGIAAGQVPPVRDDDFAFARSFWHQQGADAWRMSTQPEAVVRPGFLSFLNEITFNIDGRATLFGARAVDCVSDRFEEGEGPKIIFERSIAANLVAFFAATAKLYELAGYFGAVDVGVAVSNLRGGVGIGQTEGLAFPASRYASRTAYDADNYTRTRRLASASEMHQPVSVTMGLVDRLFAATSGRDGYSPFVET